MIRDSMMVIQFYEYYSNIYSKKLKINLINIVRLKLNLINMVKLKIYWDFKVNLKKEFKVNLEK